VGELAVRAVDLAPVLDQVEHRLFFVGQDPMQRVPAGAAVLEGPIGPAEPPALHTPTAHTQNVTRLLQRPARRLRVVVQHEQGGLLLGGETAEGRVEVQAERCFPRTSDNSIASSLTASDNRAFSALRSSIS